MKNPGLLVVSFAALALAGCKKEAPPTNEASSVAPSDEAALATPPAAPVSAGQTFADTAAASDAFEIETSKLASTRAQSAKVKRFAEQMIKAHTDSTAKLKTAASVASPAIVPNGQLAPAQQQTLDALAGKSGADFDTAYAKAQVDAHETALDALKAYANTGDVPSLKTFASGVVPVVTAHLNMAKGL